MAAWHELFPLDREPTMEDITGYIDHPLWDAFTAFIDKSYGAKPRIEYSRCGGARARALHGVPARRLLHLHGVGGLEGEG